MKKITKIDMKFIVGGLKSIDGGVAGCKCPYEEYSTNCGEGKTCSILTNQVYCDGKLDHTCAAKPE